MKRRTFVSRSALAATSLMFLRCKAEQTKAEVEKATGKKVGDFGIQLWSVRYLMDEDAIGTLKQLADIGYNDVELTGGSYSDDGKFFGIEASEFKNIVSDLGMTIKCTHTPGTGRNDTENQTSLSNNWEQYCEAVAGMGIGTVILPYLNEDERQTIDDYKWTVELLNNCALKAKDFGLNMAYHNHDFEFFEIDGQVPYDLMLESTDPELVNFEMDHYWVAKANANSVDYFKRYPGRFHYWHVKDMADSEDRFFAPVGKGIIDYPEIFKHAELSGMKNFLVEQDDYRAYKPMESMDLSHDYLRSMEF